MLTDTGTFPGPQKGGATPLSPRTEQTGTLRCSCGMTLPVASLMACLPPTQDRSSKQSCFSNHGPDEEESLRAAHGLQGSAGPEKVAKGDIKGIKSPSEEPTVESRDKLWPHEGISRGAEAASLCSDLLLLAPPSGSVC